jgi:LPXTG-motif cell wall-anchored protein
MTVQHWSRIFAAGMFTCGAVVVSVERGFAQDDFASLPREGQVTLIGCLQQGEKSNHKYYLSNVKTTIVDHVTDPACTATADMIALEGVRKVDMDSAIGKWVEISGKIEGEAHERELRVSSFKQVAVVRTVEVPGPTVTMIVPEPAAPAAPREEPPVATSGTQPAPTLPHTASPLPLVGVTGLSLIALGLGFGLLRRRENA